ncbi:hypothetical protein BUE80_DR003560 [Diplocarpon rosae]|nr:hypothetical protein BUE80_DR003560 [Diplocarpon rosae]
MRFDNEREGPNGCSNRRSRVDPSTPKTPWYQHRVQNLLSRRLHIPALSRSRPNSLSSQRDSEALPSPRSLRSLRHPFTQIVARPSTPQREHARRDSVDIMFPGAHQPPPGRRIVNVDPTEPSSTEISNHRRRRRHKVSRLERTCGPRFKDMKFLTLVFTIYLSMALSGRPVSQEFHILLILIILVTTVFFCHAMIRLCMLLLKPASPDLEAHTRSLDPQMVGPGGYAEPFAPIPVTLTRDEEAAGIESEATKLPPPAYGLWRESVRVDPNRIFWQRNADMPPLGQITERQAVSRPPSYISDDGVDYVVDAASRSVAPTAEVPLPAHFSDRGRRR